MNFEAKLLDKMREYFGEDKRKIKHAEKVLTYAKEIMKEEEDNVQVVITSAILHDISIKNCEVKYGSSDGQLQEKEGPPIAREILKDLKFDEGVISEVCSIIASHHSPREINTLNFNILWDADWLVNMKDECSMNNKSKMSKIIIKIFRTATGRQLAEKIYLHF